MKESLVFIFCAVVLAISACTPASVPPAAAEPTTAATAIIAPAETAQPTSTVDAAQLPTATLQADAAPATLTILTHDSFSASEEVIAEFERQNNVKLTFLKGGDAAATLNRAIISKESPLADVIFGVDNTFLSRAETGEILDSYVSPLLADIPEEFQISKNNLLTPVDYGDVCINYDKVYFAEKKLTPPQSLLDLTRPEYKGLLVIENPATSSPGLAFMLATIHEFGVDTYLDYWKSLKNNDLLVVNDWETAYYTHFSGSSGRGPRPMVVSYGTSPAVEVVYADPKPVDAPTASLVGPNMCFRQIEFTGILKGTTKRALAEKFVDFLLDTTFQNDIPLQMFVFPVNKKAVLPEEFIQFNQVPEKPASMDPQDIADYREEWINDWEKAIIR